MFIFASLPRRLVELSLSLQTMYFPTITERNKLILKQHQLSKSIGNYVLQLVQTLLVLKIQMYSEI